MLFAWSQQYFGVLAKVIHLSQLGLRTGAVGSEACNNFVLKRYLLPPASAVEVIESVPFVCQSVCQKVSALTAKRIDVQT